MAVECRSCRGSGDRSEETRFWAEEAGDDAGLDLPGAGKRFSLKPVVLVILLALAIYATGSRGLGH